MIWDHVARVRFPAPRKYKGHGQAISKDGGRLRLRALRQGSRGQWLYQPLPALPLVETCRHTSRRSGRKVRRNDETGRRGQDERGFLHHPSVSSLRIRKEKQTRAGG